MQKFRDLNVREAFAVGPLIALIIFLGVYPKPVLDIINPAVTQTLHDVGQTDPAAGGRRRDRSEVSSPHRLVIAAASAAREGSRSRRSPTTPSLPILIVFGAALLGVLVEAFVLARVRGSRCSW